MKRRPFVISAAVVFVMVVVAAVVFGQIGNNMAVSAADQLPAGVTADSIGESGVDVATVVSLADEKEFQVWTARDNAQNICVIVEAKETGNSASYCADQKLFQSKGVGGSMQVGVSEEGDTSVPMLQAYLLPDDADVSFATEQIPGAQLFGSLIVRYGPLVLEHSKIVAVPSKHGNIDLLVLGKDSL